MRKFHVRTVVAIVVAMLAVTPALSPSDTADAAPSERWVTSWYAAPHGSPIETPISRGGISLRQIAELTTGGSAVRLRLSNQYGTAPLTVGRTTVANRAGHSGSSTLDPATIQSVTFAGQETVTIPAGREVRSDPIQLTVASDSDLVVSSYFPTPSSIVSMHRVGTTSTWTTGGDKAGTGSGVTWGPVATRDHYVLTGVEVRSTAESTAVFLGDSITDGNESGVHANARYTDRVFDRLAADCLYAKAGIANAGISGNTLLGPDGVLQRFDRDVLQQPNVTRTVVLIGINDILWTGATSAQLIAGYRELIRMAHARSVDVYLSPITPLRGISVDPAREQTRAEVNAWIRSAGGFELLVDFDAILRNPADPGFVRPAFTNDNLHPNAAGNDQMAAIVPLWAIGTRTGPCA
jgi:lysophospholipase L1-like esterase